VIGLHRIKGIIEKDSLKTIRNNEKLGISVHEDDIQMCQNIIEQYGMLTPPVVGLFPDGQKMLLSGECEFLTLKKMGLKEMTTVNIPVEEKDTSKVSLLISTLKKSPNAISEGLLVEEILNTEEYNQYNLGKLLGKSKSWVSKRLSLVSRLDLAVRDLVIQKSLCPNSAQEIAKLPTEKQHAFAVKVANESIPKSVVETLITSYRNEKTPDGLKEQILEKPLESIGHIMEIKSVKTSKDKKTSKHQKPDYKEVSYSCLSV
jgi:ParB family chromosome partitioning protein